MLKSLPLLLLGIVLGVGGMTLAQPHEHGAGKVTPLSQREIEEKFDGQESSVTMLEVAYGPGEGSPPHRHAGPIFGYVLEGEFETALGDEPAKTLKAGETFYEPGGILHRVSRNPSQKTRTRVLAVMVHARAEKNLTVPAAKP
ncbi:MAG TPA: cupin domain-containing protein [Pirellulaceae bacterium]|nr:cupin domain-containing protein [Pirellulaceae bacterium]